MQKEYFFWNKVSLARKQINFLISKSRTWGFSKKINSMQISESVCKNTWWLEIEYKN